MPASTANVRETSETLVTQMDVPGLIDALAGLAWPLLAAVVAWRLFPTLKEIARSRAFAIKVGKVELSVQEANEKLRRQIGDLQNKVLEIRANTDRRPRGETAGTGALAALPKRLVWVDDNPANNAYEIARLREDGVEVVELTSTAEALTALVSEQLPTRAVISDMVRREAGKYNQEAGLDLIRRLREAGLTVPIFVYCSSRALKRTEGEVMSAGGNGAMASAVELMERLREVLESS